MAKLKDKFIERRKYVRLQTPISLSYILPESGNVQTTSTKNISADGLRFETYDRSLKEASVVELRLSIPQAANPVHAKGRVVWKKKMSLADAAPFDCGIEFVEIEEDNKNTFLKFLCDLIYDIKKESKNAKKS